MTCIIKIRLHLDQPGPISERSVSSQAKEHCYHSVKLALDNPGLGDKAGRTRSGYDPRRGRATVPVASEAFAAPGPSDVVLLWDSCARSQAWTPGRGVLGAPEGRWGLPAPLPGWLVRGLPGGGNVWPATSVGKLAEGRDLGPGPLPLARGEAHRGEGPLGAH